MLEDEHLVALPRFCSFIAFVAQAFYMLLPHLTAAPCRIYRQSQHWYSSDIQICITRWQTCNQNLRKLGHGSDYPSKSGRKSSTKLCLTSSMICENQTPLPSLSTTTPNTREVDSSRSSLGLERGTACSRFVAFLRCSSPIRSPNLRIVVHH